MKPTQIIDKLAWIYIENKKILMTRSKGKDAYYIPGGKREGSETDSEALIREVKEELSVNLIPSLKLVGVFQAQAHGKPEGVFVKMTCYSGNFTGELKPSSEIEEITWFNHRDKEKTGPVDKIIFDHLKKNGLLQ